MCWPGPHLRSSRFAGLTLTELMGVLNGDWLIRQQATEIVSWDACAMCAAAPHEHQRVTERDRFEIPNTFHYYIIPIVKGEQG